MKILLQIFFTYFFLNFTSLNAQNSVDSLSHLLESHTKEDSFRVDILNKLGFSYWNKEPMQTEKLGKEALVLAEKLKYKMGIAEAYRILGVSYWIRGKYVLALDMALNSLRIFKEINYTPGIGRTYGLLGLIYDEQKQYDDALVYHLKSLDIHIALADSNSIARTYNNIGAIYFGIKNYERSREYFDKSLTMRKALNDLYGMAEAMNNLAAVYRQQGRNDESLAMHKEGLKIKEKINNINGSIVSLENIGVIYFDRKDYKQADFYYQKALALALQTGIKKWQQEIYGLLYHLEEKRGDAAKALDYYKKYVAVKDSLFNQTKSKQIAELQSEFEFEKKEQEIALLQKDNRIRTLWRNIFGFGLGLVVLFTFLTYRFFKYRNRKNRELIETRLKETELRAETAELRVQTSELLADHMQAEAERHELELEEASQLQLSLLPKKIPDCKGYEIKAYMKTASEVGGDYYDIIPLDRDCNRLAFCLADVSGKGLGAALLMANLQATIRSQSLMAGSAKECMETANNLIYQTTDTHKFVTLFYGILDVDNNKINYCNAGHDFPFLFNSNENPLRLETGGIPLGSFSSYKYSEGTAEIKNGDRLVIYSDGIPEAKNEDDMEFGEEQLQKVLNENRTESSEKLIEKIVSAIKEHTSNVSQSDDITLLIIEGKEN